ncbi:MAG: beta-N-acetylhexosaminidase [Sulfitobacter sp.]|uniref:beta-N-acetylhexosaminidase n=1 Tax=Sulfitobacter TaxID=60136 RepID=UPI000E77E92C|nr:MULTISPECIES: beta-N-acetylhexosaminidase [Sulfitobacter]AYE86166.1 beta-N-acetylhexosaminidase [Sulfitobacter sp. D7]UWR35949.1 beta-N-acetylhexosaminidase [Sulfitobacter sp. W074]WOI14258.1 beta-N-acetylhexosaminidase [Sulfitobacter sp. LC.270.F.C4]
MRPFGATILDATGLQLSVEEKAFFRDVRPFGFILFARNIDSPDQVRALCDEMREAAGHEAVITIDQEGGRVQRMRAPQWRDWMPPMELAARAGERATKAFYLMYRIIAHELHSVGIDSNCAPLIDVAGPKTHPFLRNRCYGETPGQVAEIGRAVADALLAGGVLPVMKHMPGHGRATLDSHHNLPRVDARRIDLEAVDFAPFRSLRDLPMGMTAHLVYDALDDTPATLSSEVMRIIRDDIGFDNLVMTDDISMKALQMTPAGSTRAAIAAGCDVALFCNGPLEERRAVAEAAGEMTTATQTRALRALDARQTPDDVDIDALSAQLETLLGGALHG